MGAIRGAVCAENTVGDISDQSVRLISEIIRANALQAERIEAIIFTATKDLTACYPATAVRTRLNLPNTAFMCCAEMDADGAMPHCIRACVVVSGLAQSDCKHCYLGKAQALRSDLGIDR